ncbi:hypothetical protein [Spiroplasma endosymbiont of Nephrotoma flavescens]|uniref:hypothetical protein n=1 Tax=Spiroplasma endosymbiont of Nephrotoma flavescens TaxID=3066302 RepID=UPI00313BB3C3
MKLMNIQKLLKLMATITIISGPLLPAIACSNNANDYIITTNGINVSTLDVNKSKLIAKSLILARTKQWNPNEILKRALQNNFKDLNDYFVDDTIKNLVLTKEHHNFSKPDYQVPKTLEVAGFNILEKIKAVLQEFIKNNDFEIKNFMEKLLEQLLGLLNSEQIAIHIPDIKAILTTQYQDIVVAIKSGIDTNKKFITDKKTFGEIFADIKHNKIIEDNIFSKFLKIQNKSIEIKDIAILIKTIITYVPILITFMINFAEKLENGFNEEIINDLKAKPYQGLLDNKDQSFTLQNIKNTFKNIFGVNKKKVDFLIKLISDSSLPFNSIFMALQGVVGEKEFNNFYQNLNGDELDNDFIAIIDQLLLKLPKVYDDFITLLEDKTAISKVDFLKKLIKIMGANINDKTSIEKETILDYLTKILGNKWFQDNALQNIIDNKSIWEEDGDYIADFVNKLSYIQDTKAEIVYDPSAGLVFYNITIEKQEFKFSWKFFYSNEKKLIGMKIFNFEQLN